MAMLTYDESWQHEPDTHSLKTLERMAADLSRCDITNNDIVERLDRCIGVCKELRTKGRRFSIRMRLRFLERGGAREILNSIKCKMHSNNVLVKGFQTLEVLCYGLPDMQDYIASEGGVDLIIEALKRFPNSAIVQQQGCLSLTTIAYKRDNVKGHVLRSGGVEVVFAAMFNFTDQAVVVQSTFECLRCLSLEFAPVQELFVDTLPIKHFITAMKSHPLVEAVVQSGCAIITSLCSFQPIIAGAFIKEGVLEYLWYALNQFSDSVQLQCRTLEAINNFYFNAETIQEVVIKEIEGNGTIECVFLTLQRFPDISEIQARGMKLLGLYCTRSSEMRQLVNDMGAVNIVLLALTKHFREMETVVSCVRFLSKLLAHEPEITKQAIEMEGPKVIHDDFAFYNANLECYEIRLLCIQIMCLVDPNEFRSVLRGLSFDSADEVSVAHKLDVIVSVCLAQQKEIGTASCAQIYCFEKGIIDKVLSVMATFPEKEIIQEKGCNTISMLCDGANRIKHYISLKHGVQLILDAMKTHASVALVQETGNKAISRLCRGAPHVQCIVLDHEGTDVVLRALENLSDNPSVVGKSMRCLRDVCFSFPKAKRDILVKRGVTMVIKCMRQHSGVAEIQVNGCDVLAYICHQEPEIRLRVQESEGLETILQSLRSFSEDDRLQGKAMLALTSVCFGEKTAQELLFQKGGVELIILALHRFPSVSKVQEKGLQALRVMCFHASDIQAHVIERYAVQLALDALRIHEGEDDVVIQALGAIRTLCQSTHFPADLATRTAIVNVSRMALSKHGDDIYVATSCFYMIERLCSQLVGFRTEFCQSGVIRIILLVLQNLQTHASTVIAACKVFASLCSEHEQARDDLADQGGMYIVREAMDQHAENCYVQSAAQEVLNLAHISSSLQRNLNMRTMLNKSLPSLNE